VAGRIRRRRNGKTSPDSLTPRGRRNFPASRR
jgi:hypothetical protein